GCCSLPPCAANNPDYC
uniref:Alpha-conotoxin PnIA n=1 Tax=Conus pennaceus TaxID=37335 RepID=CA1A_CONPE|nr:RecName: Full=Alpha-conotoxin PnIA; Short=Alpha-PnIA [Conus pennaceus]AAB31731.1 alpha PnIA=mollusc-specific alpha-conotoxin [Conus pennaceus=snails, venom, Peptide, 16 aa] [Conus pennaceus]